MARYDFDLIGEIYDIQTIAKGKGVDVREFLNRTYGYGRWRKLKGKALIRYRSDGRVVLSEIHWFEANGIGKVRLKAIRDLE